MCEQLKCTCQKHCSNTHWVGISVKCILQWTGFRFHSHFQVGQYISGTPLQRLIYAVLQTLCFDNNNHGNLLKLEPDVTTGRKRDLNLRLFL